MRILFLNPGGTIGGAERALLDAIAGLRALNRGWSFALITAAPGHLIDEVKELGASAEVIPFPTAFAAAGDAGVGGPAGDSIALWRLMARLWATSPAIAMYSKKLARAISDAAPDLVHTNGFKMHVLGAWATPRQVPLLWHVHDYVRVRPVMSRLLRLHARRCATVVANSASVAGDVLATLGARVPLRTIWNAVNLARFSPDGPHSDLDALCRMPAAASGTIRVGLVATMARWKGHETFVRALSMLSCDLPIRGYIIGGPAYQTDGSQYTFEELRASAVRMGIADRLGFTGYLREPAAAMRSLDIVVHASTAPEPFGLVIAEAFACGRAVIASAAGGAAEIVDSDKTAILHRPGDAGGLAHKIMRLAADAGLRTRLGIAAHRMATRHFTRERLAAELTAVYRRLATAAP